MRQAHNQEFISQCIHRLNLNTSRIEKCLEQLSEKEVWQRPNQASNSIGNLILHLCGNITQYVISSIGNNPDERLRDAEFAADGGYTKQELLDRLRQTVGEATTILQHLVEADLMKVHSVQGFEYTAIGSIIHVVEHYSYHTGQIAFWTKCLKNEDLGFYAGMDLNKRNKPTD